MSEPAFEPAPAAALRSVPAPAPDAAPQRRHEPPAPTGVYVDPAPAVAHGLPASEPAPPDAPAGRLVDDRRLAGNPAPTGVDPARVSRPMAGQGLGRSATRPPPTEKDRTRMTPDFTELAEIARELRIDVIKMLHLARSGHPGGSLGMADVFTALWFGGHMNVDPKNPAWTERDRFVLSNGHICPILYAILARKGYFPRDELWTLRKLGSSLQGHPDFHHTQGVDCCTGSLGNGVSVGLGMALGTRVRGGDFRVYVGSSDGESQEGQVWEMASAAAHYGVDNLTVLVDRNGIQIDGFTKDVIDQGDLRAKYEAFGWHARDVDGHDLHAIHDALVEARAVKGRPQVIVCHTVLGKGVSFMENEPKWHGVAPDDEQCKRALAELGES